MSEMVWQPIETAPMDGTLVLLFYGSQGRLRSYRLGYWDTGQWATAESGWVDEWRQLRSDQPTHWMPLPAPPSATPTP